MIDAIQLATTSHSGSANCYDGDYGTSVAISCGTGNPSCSQSHTSQHDFDGLHRIIRLRYKTSWAWATSAGASENRASAYNYIEYKLNGGSWTSYKTVGSGGDGNASGSGSLDETVEVDLVDCVGIRIRAVITAYRSCAPECGGSESSSAYIYEVSALYVAGGFSSII